MDSERIVVPGPQVWLPGAEGENLVDVLIDGETRPERERGQALVLIAFAMTVLIAFTALAIDGGMAYAERREAQNAADAGTVAGTYQVIKQKRNGTFSQQTVRAGINKAVQQHGIADTDSNPSNHVNTNVSAVYTDDAGQVIGGGCEVTACTATVASQAEGVHVRVVGTFDTFFAGIVGHESMSAGAEAVGVVREGPPTNGLCAIFAQDSQSCEGFVANLSGSSITVIGTAHSNADFKMTGSNTLVTGAITFKDYCHHCVSAGGGDVIYPVPPIRNLDLPTLADYQALAYGETAWNGSSPGGQLSGSQSPSANAILGTEAAPFTYISGDLTLGSKASSVTLTGLVYVTGDVKIQGDYLKGAFVLVAAGEINLTNARYISGEPYTNASYPLLADNGVRLYSGLNRSSGGGNPCNTPVIKISGSNNYINGTIMAPHGKIDISGATNTIDGALIADSVSSSGSSNTVRYNADYFPPQADRLELLR